jgi:hypothetical protein
VQTENCVSIGIVTETLFEKKCFSDRKSGDATVARTPEYPRWRSVGGVSRPDVCSRYNANYTDPMGTDARDAADWLSQNIEVAREFYMPDGSDDDGGALSVSQDFLTNTLADISQGAVDMLRVGSSTGEVYGQGGGDFYDYGMALSQDTARGAALFTTIATPIAIARARNANLANARTQLANEMRAQASEMRAQAAELRRQVRADIAKINRESGTVREISAKESLQQQYPNASLESQRYLRDSAGKIIRDPLTGKGRKIDYVVVENSQCLDCIEVTSPTATKAAQIAKEERIRASGGQYIRLRNSKKTLIDVSRKKTRLLRKQ